jgi:hypothetical protein
MSSQLDLVNQVMSKQFSELSQQNQNMHVQMSELQRLLQAQQQKEVV